MSKDIFMRTDRFGDLYIYDVLLSYIYPRVFVCEDDYDSKYLFYEMDSNEKTDTWLVTKIKKTTYYDLVDKKSTIQDAYNNSRKQDRFEIRKKYGERRDKIEVGFETDKWLAELPTAPVYADKPLTEEYVSETLKVARETGKTTFDVRLYPGTDRHSVANVVFQEICSSINSMAAAVYGTKPGDSLLVSTAPGSCVIRFSIDDKINLLNETSLENSFEVLNGTLEYGLIEESICKTKNKESYIRNYNKLLETIKKTGSDVRFTTASPNSTDIKSIEFTKENVIEQFDKAVRYYNEKTYEDELEGELIAIDLKSKRFKLLQKGDITIQGELDKSMSEEGFFNVPGYYCAKVIVTEKVNKSDYNKKRSYRVLELIAKK